MAVLIAFDVGLCDESVMKTLIARTLFSFSALAMATSAQAGEAFQPTEVYELFTSQGCSSCPPANAQLDKLSTKADTLALSYGVTYWDYLGWKDTFAKPEFTERQHAYVKALGGRNPYTPQFVLNGRTHSPRLTGLSEAGDLQDQIVLRDEDGTLSADGEGQALLVSFTPGRQDVPVARGENGGKTLSLTNVVTDVELVSLPHEFAPKDGQGYAVLKHGSDLSVTAAAAWTP